MLQICLENKVIFDFLTFYDKNCWQRLIPSLLEIAILNLKYSFNRLFFSQEDIHNIIKDLKLNLRKKIYNIKNSKSIRIKDQVNKISKSPSNLRTPIDWDEPDNYQNYRNTHSYKKNKDNNLNKKLSPSIKSKRKEQVDIDKQNYYDNINDINNQLSKSFNEKERINYAISYDKDLKPEIIERTTIRKDKNKKVEKKIIQKMTQKEYEERYIEENKNNNEIKNEENEDDYDKNIGQKLIEYTINNHLDNLNKNRNIY